MAAMNAENVPAVEAPEGGQAPVEGGQAPEGGGLPSEGSAEKSPWDRAVEDGYLPADTARDPYELAKSASNAQKFVNEANAEKAKLGKANQEAATKVATAEEIVSMVPEFMKNDMQLTPEMETRATELGIDIRDLKLSAIEMRDNVNAAYNVVGGEAEYSAMMTEMSELMTDQEKKAFNADMGGTASKYAIAGLHAEWKSRQGGNEAPSGRVEGKVGNSSSVKPYADQGEMLRDLSYLKTRGQNDKAARAKYESRKAVTSDNVIFGR